MSEDQDICRIVLHLIEPDETLEFAVVRSEVVHFLSVVNNLNTVFVNINGTGIPIRRIASYNEEDMNGESVYNKAFIYTSLPIQTVVLPPATGSPPSLPNVTTSEDWYLHAGDIGPLKKEGF